MSFITILDRLFDEKNLLDLLYGYYLQYVGVENQYWNLETLEVIDAIPIERPDDADQQGCEGIIEGNIFTVIDTQTKEVLFKTELDDPCEASYFEDKWIVECDHEIKIYDDNFHCITIKTSSDCHIVHFTKDRIFVKRNWCMAIYNWNGKLLISINGEYHCYNDTKITVSNPDKVDVYNLQDFLILKTFAIKSITMESHDKYIVGITLNSYYIIDLESLDINMIPRSDIIDTENARHCTYYLSTYVKDDILYALTSNTTMVLYSLSQNIILKTLVANFDHSLGMIKIIHLTSNHLIFEQWGKNDCCYIQVLNLGTFMITNLNKFQLRGLITINTTNGVLYNDSYGN